MRNKRGGAEMLQVFAGLPNVNLTSEEISSLDTYRPISPLPMLPRLSTADLLIKEACFVKK